MSDAQAKRRVLLSQVMTFGLVGGVGFILDTAVFNLLRATVLSPHVHGGPIWAKVISVSIAIIANWVGNRYWTFRTVRRPDVLREAVEFTIVSLLGSGIALLCLWMSHYVLGFTSDFADNLSANVIGLALGSAFRFGVYRGWVYASSRTVHSPGRVAAVAETSR